MGTMYEPSDVVSAGDRLALRVLRATHDDSVAGEDIWWRVDNLGELRISINCSDLFFWGSADAEPITAENIDLFEETMQLGREIEGDLDACFEAYALFCARVRKERPQGAWYQLHVNAESPWYEHFNAVGPERETGLGNPRKQT